MSQPLWPATLQLAVKKQIPISDQSLTAFMISKSIADSSVPMSLLAQRPRAQFNYYWPCIGTYNVMMH